MNNAFRYFSGSYGRCTAPKTRESSKQRKIWKPGGRDPKVGERRRESQGDGHEKFQGKGCSTSPGKNPPEGSRVTRTPSCRDAATCDVLEHNGDGILVWQRFWDELVAASQKNMFIYNLTFIYIWKCNHSNLHGSTLNNNFVIIILSTLNIDLVGSMALTIPERWDRGKWFGCISGRGKSKRAYFLSFILEYE